MRRAKYLSWGGLVAAALLALGCDSQLQTVVVNQLTDPPFPAKAQDDRIEIYEGTAVGVEIWAFDEEPEDPYFTSCNGTTCRRYDNPIDPEDVGVGTSGNVSIHFVEDSTYVIVGERAGQGSVLVTALDTDGIIEIPVTVLPQPGGSP